MTRVLAVAILVLLPALVHGQGRQAVAEVPRSVNPSLEAFIAKKKFLPEGRYPGAPSEAVRNQLEGQLNALAKRLMKEAPSAPAKDRVLAEFKAVLPAFEFADTEERERVLDYLVEIMDIYGIESSDGLLNKWFYGFDPSKPVAESVKEARTAMNGSERAFAELLDQLTAESAVTVLTQALGAPAVGAGPTYMWLNSSNADRAVSVSARGDKTYLIWMNKGQFVYSRELQ